MCFEFFRYPVFLWKFCICLMFFMTEWFLMVFILLFKCTFAGSLICLALVGKGKIKFIHKFTVYCSCYLFRDSFFIMHIDNWFSICQTAVTYFHIISHYLMIFMAVGKCVRIKWKKYLPILLEMFFEKDGLTQIFFFAMFRWFTFVFIVITWWLVLKFLVVPRLI